jgi:hypothetical protein
MTNSAQVSSPTWRKGDSGPLCYSRYKLFYEFSCQIRYV